MGAPVISRPDLALSCIAALAACWTLNSGPARAAPAVYGKSFNYVEEWQQCVSGRCRAFAINGKLQVTRDGKVLYFFPVNNAFGSRGILLEANRTVDLRRGGRLPRGFKLGQLLNLRQDPAFPEGRYLADLALVDGVASTRINERTASTTIVLDFAGPTKDGPATVGSATTRIQFDYTYDFEPGSDIRLGGQGNIQGAVNGSVNGAPLNLGYTSSSRFRPL